MKEFLVCLALLTLFTAAGVIVLQIPEQDWKKRVGAGVCLFVSLGVAAQILQIGITYWQDQQAAEQRARERKEDKKFQDRLGKSTDDVAATTNSLLVEHRLNNQALLNAIELKSDDYAARFPLGYAAFSATDEAAYQLTTGAGGVKVKLETDWKASTVKVNDNIAEVSLKDVAFEIIRENRLPIKAHGIPIFAEVALVAKEQHHIVNYDDVEVILEVAVPNHDSPAFVIGFRKVPQRPPVLIGGNQPEVFSTNILHKDDPTLTPEQKRVFEGQDGLSENMKDGPWVEIQFRGGMSAPEDENEKNVLFSTSFLQIVPAPTKTYPYVNFVKKDDESKPQARVALQDEDGKHVRRVVALPLFETERLLKEGKSVQDALWQAGRRWEYQPLSEPKTSIMADFPYPSGSQHDYFEIRVFQDKLRTIQFALIGQSENGRYAIAARVYEVVGQADGKTKIKLKPQFSQTAKEMQLVNGKVPFLDDPDKVNPRYEVVSD